ncbi:MAG TPA: trimethylamine methyltransferase family protein [Dehalococcoidales bacterium]|nr:trimethylamine methyltransferase family protein [Dehalococcoidales bacterium]
MTKLRIEGVLTESERERIHRSAVTLLEKLGFMCNHPGILEAFRQAGCEVGDEIAKPKGARVVTFTEEIISDALNKAPSQFTLYPIAPGYREIKFGSGEVYFATTGSNSLWDIETGELRDAVLSDFVTGSRLIDALENFDANMGYPHYWMYDVARMDEYEKYGLVGALMNAVPMLHCGKAQIRVFECSTEQELTDNLNLWAITAGGKEAFRRKPTGAIMVCFTSPLSLIGRTEPGEPLGWADWLWGGLNAGVPFVIKPSGIIGASSPVTVAGSIVQGVAEILATLVAIQAIIPGHPIVFGDFTGSLDMITGGKGNCNPEALLLHLGLDSMAHYYNKPSLWFPGSINAVGVDSQAAWEHAETYLLASLAGVNMTMSSGGLGQGMAGDYRQYLVDNEIIGTVKHIVKGINMNEEAIPLDLMIDTGFGASGANFLGSEHTRRLYKTEMWRRSSLTNTLTWDAWKAQGKKTLWDRAGERARELLKKHKPDIPEGLQEEIRGYLLQALNREGVKGDQAKRIMDKTYWNG